MPIYTNDDSAEVTNAGKTMNPDERAGFAGTTFSAAPTAKSGDFLGFTSRIGISRIDATIAPYLEKVKALVSESLKDVALERLEKLSNCYAFRYQGPDGRTSLFGLLFSSSSDPAHQDLLPVSIKLSQMGKELRDRFGNDSGGVNLVDARVVLSGYQPDMDRAEQMADTIVRTFQAATDSEIKNAQISVLTGNEFVVDWNPMEARRVESQLSPHGVRPRIELGLTLKAKIRNEWGQQFRNMADEYKVLGTIGGYIDFRPPEQVIMPNGQRTILIRPVFNITTIIAEIPLPGVAMILLTALAPTIYNTLWWVRQFQDMSNGKPNLGMLEEDPNNRGTPFILKDQAELKTFAETYLAAPLIALQFQDGRDNIPGMYPLATNNSESKNQFFANLSHFFGVDDDANNRRFDPSIILESRYDGVTGDASGTLTDSRYIDYLQIAATNGYGSVTDDMRRVLFGISENPTDRARIIANVTGSFAPVWLDTVALLNPDLMKWVASLCDQRGLVVTDPNGQLEARPLSTLISNFGTTSDLRTIVSSGQVSRGAGFSTMYSGW